MISTSNPNNTAEKENRISGIRLFFLIMMLMGQLAGSPAQSPDRIAMAYKNQLVRIFEYRDSLEGVHPFVKGLYPIAIAEDNHLYVFDLDESLKNYRLVAYEEIEMKIPKGIRAAFPIQFYDNKCACVVSGEVFDTPQGYVTIFHEFIHCHQWHTVEPALREQLPLAQKAAEKGDYMWEMNHQFPYTEPWFEKTYTKFIRAAENNDQEQVKALRQELAEILNDDDYQYMVWQEWKEGFALFVENKLRNHLKLPSNMVGRQVPYNRTVFYAGGEAYINLLSEKEPELQTDLELLFHRMY
jgi:hypothetical protein